MVYGSQTIDVNMFLYEVSKLKFTRSLSESVNECKEKLFTAKNEVK